MRGQTIIRYRENCRTTHLIRSSELQGLRGPHGPGYGRYFGMKVGVFREAACRPFASGGSSTAFCLTGKFAASAAAPYSVFGYKGAVATIFTSTTLSARLRSLKRQSAPVRSLHLGGGREQRSMLEAIAKSKGKKLSGKTQLEIRRRKPQWRHICLQSQILAKFRSHYPNWSHHHQPR